MGRAIDRISSQYERMRRARADFASFVDTNLLGGILLAIATVVALGLANSPAAGQWFDLWRMQLGVSFGTWAFEQSLLHWLNDGLMALFFFVVGLEIKREVLVGELSDPRRAALPIIAAIGGMLAPALIYAAFNHGGPDAAGWGVPMATDIAFALGILALLGDRVPIGLKVFLAALAIADDLGAILVIAVYYSGGIAASWAFAGLAIVGLLYLMGRIGVRRSWPFAIGGILVWWCTLQAGVHPTVAGVLVAFAIPATQRTEPSQFVEWARAVLDEIIDLDVPGRQALERVEQHERTEELCVLARETQAPLHRMEHTLQPLATLLIVPLFALANAGVPLSGIDIGALVRSPAPLGIALGLLIGKQLGITTFAYLAVRSGVSSLPEGVGWQHIWGASLLGGVGFTMSLFIAHLAFGTGDALNAARLSIMATSLVAGVLGWIVLQRTQA